MPIARHLSPREVAELLSCSYDGALKIMRRAGAVKIGGLVRVSEDVLSAYLDSCREPTEDAPGSTMSWASTRDQLRALRRRQ